MRSESFHLFAGLEWNIPIPAADELRSLTPVLAAVKVLHFISVFIFVDKGKSGI